MPPNASSRTESAAVQKGSGGNTTGASSVAVSHPSISRPSEGMVLNEKLGEDAAGTGPLVPGCRTGLCLRVTARLAGNGRVRSVPPYVRGNAF